MMRAKNQNSLSRSQMDLTGHQYGKLTVLRFSHFHIRPNGDRAAMWLCQCECGEQTVTGLGNLRSGGTVSCGCGIRVALIKRNTTHGLSNIKTGEYVAWIGIRRRCSPSANNKDRKWYFDRGIRVCARWAYGENGLSAFECFLADMGRKPSPSHSVDRKNGNLGYGPENCHWATPKEQAVNRSDVRKVCIEGREMSVRDAAILHGLKPATVLTRIRRSGWAIETALNTSVGVAPNHHTKLTDHDVAEIRESISSASAIATQYGVTASHVRRLRRSEPGRR